MHSPSCHGTVVVIRGCVLWRPPSGLQRTGFCRLRGHQPHHTSALKSLRDFSFSPRDIGGMS
jgi:hypothetical protein